MLAEKVLRVGANSNEGAISVGIFKILIMISCFPIHVLPFE